MFFDSTIWAKQRQPLNMVPFCGACGLHSKCKSPWMKVSGEGRKKTLIVAEAPGETEDERGIQLIGNAGQELIRILQQINVNMRRDCWLTNAVICRPSWEDSGDNREPTKDEIKFCRPNLSKTIQELKPDVIIPLGKASFQSLIALAWRDGEVDKAGRWVGWQIPSIKLNAWICPTYHPSYLLREKNQALELHTRNHLKAAFKLKGKPHKIIPDYDSCVRIVTPKEAVQAIRSLCALGATRVPLSFDYETTCLKPDGKFSQIICCSISDGKVSYAFPWREPAISQMVKFFRSDIDKVGANIKFEHRWTKKTLSVTIKNWLWDTVLGAHWKDCRRGICSLKFQSFILLGMPDYNSILEDHIEGKGGYGMNNLKNVDQSVLLHYNGLDALLEHKVAMIQMRQYNGTA